MKFLTVIFSSIVFSAMSFAQPSTANSPRALVHLLDYLAQDYSGAVQGGKVISKSEYQEQLEFSETAENMAKNLSEIATDKSILQNLSALRTLIANRSSDSQVAKLAQATKTKVISLTHLAV